MKIAVVGKAKEKNIFLEKKFKAAGFSVDRIEPEIVICYGGDGTFLYNERKYPGIPKLLMRGRNICRLCQSISIHSMIERLKKGKYRIQEFPMLEARLKNKIYHCANDFVIRNIHPARALRFSVTVDNKKLGTMIGDGVVISTPFGSTGYYKSITRDSFTKGIGIAFNNNIERINHLVLPEDSIISVKVERDRAHFSIDNQRKVEILSMGDKATVRKSRRKIRVIRLQ